MPVANEDFALAEFVFEAGRDEAEFPVVIGGAGNEDLETALDSEAGGNDEDVFREALVLRVGDFIEDLPGDEHGHDDGFAGASGHFGAEANKWAAVTRNVYADAFGGGSLGEPDESFNGFELAEEEAVIFALLRIAPMFEQAFGDAGNAGVAGVAPGFYAGTNFVGKGEFDEDAGSSKAFEDSEARTKPAGRRPGTREKRRDSRSYFQCSAGSL